MLEYYSKQDLSSSRLEFEGRDVLVPRPISSGIRDPHCTTLQMDCSSSNQNARISSNTTRVNSGSRTRYDRTREGLKGSGGKAGGVAMIWGSGSQSSFETSLNKDDFGKSTPTTGGLRIQCYENRGVPASVSEGQVGQPGVGASRRMRRRKERGSGRQRPRGRLDDGGQRTGE